MSTLANIQQLNEAALAYRDTVESTSPSDLRRATLSQLLKFPAYVGFVEASFIADLSFVMFLCDRDDGIALRLLWKREFEAASLAIWRRLVMDSDLVVDVGGHTGIYSIVAGLTNPTARVHTFEPHEMNFGRLLLNLRANGLTGKNAHCLAASRAAGVVPFQVEIQHYLQAGGSVVSDGQKFAKMVPAGAVDDHVPLSAKKVSVKIDTEGHEAEVLAGMPNLLQLRPDIILECAFVPSMGETDAMLKNSGYRFFYIDERCWELDAVDTLVAPPAKLGPTERENVLLTTMSEEQVRALFNLARTDYESSSARLSAVQHDNALLDQ